MASRDRRAKRANRRMGFQSGGSSLLGNLDTYAPPGAHVLPQSHATGIPRRRVMNSGVMAQPLTRKLPRIGVTPANYSNGLRGIAAIGDKRATARLGKGISRGLPSRKAVLFGAAAAIGVGSFMNRSGRATDRGRNPGIYGY